MTNSHVPPGIKPGSQRWEASVLPLRQSEKNHHRSNWCSLTPVPMVYHANLINILIIVYYDGPTVRILCNHHNLLHTFFCVDFCVYALLGIQMSMISSFIYIVLNICKLDSNKPNSSDIKNVRVCVWDFNENRGKNLHTKNNRSYSIWTLLNDLKTCMEACAVKLPKPSPNNCVIKTKLTSLSSCLTHNCTTS